MSHPKPGPRSSPRSERVPARHRVVFLTGTRADFGKMKSLIKALHGDPERFDVHIFATGMHMEPRYGYTVEEIEKCGFSPIYRFINQSAQGVMDRTLAQTILGFGDYVRLVEPDLIVVHGDRSEALAGAMVGALNNVRVAHVEGGEVSGTIDESIRHAVSKLSHLHLVANEAAARRLVQLGELPESIHVIGSPEVDAMGSAQLPSIEEVLRHYEIPFSEYGLFVFHPVTTSPHTLRREVREVIAALRERAHPIVAIFPNSDAGSELLLAELEAELYPSPWVRAFPSIRFEYVLVLLREARFIVGNSSMGVREAPYYGVPTVNVGSRQEGRSDNASILHVPAERAPILAALRRAERMKGALSPSAEFGEGESHLRFRAVLEEPSTWSRSVQKRFRDLPENPSRSAA